MQDEDGHEVKAGAIKDGIKRSSGPPEDGLKKSTNQLYTVLKTAEATHRNFQMKSLLAEALRRHSLKTLLLKVSSLLHEAASS